MSSLTLLDFAKPRRCYAHRSEYRYVRRVKGRSFQARVPLAGGRKWEGVNLGLFSADEWGSMTEAEWAAGRAAKEYVKRHRPGRDPWEVVRELQSTFVGGLPIVPATVLPRWVYRRSDGRFGARCKRPTGGVEIDLTGPFLTPEAAHSAARGWVSRSDPFRNHYLPPLGGVLEVR